MEKPKDFIKTKSGLVLEVINSSFHKDWMTTTARDASGQLYYLDSRKDVFESLPKKDNLECNIILLRKRIKEIDTLIGALIREQEATKKTISIYKERLERPIEDLND